MPSVMSSVAMALLLVGSVAGDATMGSCMAGQGACTGEAEGDGSALLQVTKQKADPQHGRCGGGTLVFYCPPECCLVGPAEHYRCQFPSDFDGGVCPGDPTPVPTPAPTPAPTPIPTPTPTPSPASLKVCPGSGVGCSGDQCCPGIDLSDGLTFPCLDAKPGWNQCQGSLKTKTSAMAPSQNAAPAPIPATCAFGNTSTCPNKQSWGLCEQCFGRTCNDCKYMECTMCLFCKSYCTFGTDGQVTCEAGAGGYTTFCEGNLDKCLGCVSPYHS
mmetsp:Transcript_34354/g.88712  ORF Transcript_34354/g.88712 Transcript_34354/m.88712 type:complete len:272 (+) Transcript_34354:88-903(+)